MRAWQKEKVKVTLVNYYEDVFSKARATLAEKKIDKRPVKFQDIRISAARTKVFWFVTRAKRKIMRGIRK